MCGENPSRRVIPWPIRGSSPRVRGKRCCGYFPSVDLWAHPRVCGENRFPPDVLRRCLGSSPRVRGKPSLQFRWNRLGGLIPACAGKTTGIPVRHPTQRAHPRVCGENCLERTYITMYNGSSPRVRGKHRDGDLCRYCGGLIPACAGKTFYSMINRAAFGAHPRVCGEN